MKVASVSLFRVNNQNKNELPSRKTKEVYPLANKITFNGNDKNSNQIAVLATECVPYSVSGGLGSVTRDMTKAYKEHYPNKDLRILLPYYNSLKNFDIEDTGIQTDFKYGIRKSTAKLYKVNEPESGVPTYFVSFPELENLDKEYSLDDYSLFEKYVAFSCASVAILEKMKNSNENFNPKILHTKDWHTAYAQNVKINHDMKTVHELLNANSNFHGKVNPLAAALNLFPTEQIETLKHNPDFKREMFTLTINNKQTLLKGLNENSFVDVNDLLNESESFDTILKNLAENYPKVLYKPKNYYSHLELNNVVRKTFPNVNWDENQDFNPTVNAISRSDAWFTISDAHFHELLEDPYFSSYSLYNMLRLNLNKGEGILNRIDVDRYNPANPEQVKIPYNVETYKTGKQQNKDFLFEQFSRDNILTTVFDKRLITNNNAKIYGYLDKQYKDYPLAVNISRFDTNQKGSDIALDMAKKLLEQDEKINFVFGLPNFENTNPQMLSDFVKDVVENPKYQGRVLLIDGYLPINEYLAAADISIIPSRSETCGLVGYQSMRMGAIPVSSPVGSMKDCLITPDMNIHKAMGFLTPVHFSKSKNPVNDLTNTMTKALSYYGTPQFDDMIENCMNYDSSWTNAVIKQNELYDKLINEDSINELTINDITKSGNNLKILRQRDIPNLPEADVLVCMAHPDDEIFFVPMLKYLDEGKSVQVVYAAKGEKGHYKVGAPTTKENLAKHRENEMLNSLHSLGITRNPLKLDYPDLEIAKPNYTRQLNTTMEKIIEQVNPEIVLSFGPDGITSNADHKKVGEIAHNVAIDYGAKSYQIALTRDDVEDFKEIAQEAKTDAFDFISPTEETIVEKFDLSDYEEEIKNSLKAHRSQWSDDEVKALADFYANHKIGITELDEYPEITENKNMWEARAKHFQTNYGEEFSPIPGGICYKPQDENYAVNLYLADNGKNKEHLWVESPVFGVDYNTSGAVDDLLDKYDEIKQLPQFEQVKFIDLVVTNYFGKRFKVVISEDEISRLAGRCDKLCQNPEVFLEKYNKKYNDSKIKMYMLD